MARKRRRRTDFTQYTFAQLSQMLDQSNPASCQNAAQSWESTGQLLSEQVQNLQAQLSSMDSGWTGTAATDYKKMITDLARGIQKVADTAFTMRNVMYDSFDALTTARAQMAAIPDVPAVSPGTLTLATTPVNYNHILSLPTAAELGQQAAAQQAVAAATSAQAKAAAVMNALATTYMTAQADIPPSPADAVPMVPSSSPSGTASGAGAPASGGGSGAALTNPGSGVTAPVTLAPTNGLSSSLFGDMFTVGLAATAAASAAFGGRASLLPKSASKQNSQNALPGSGRPALGGAAAGAVGVVGGAVAGPAVNAGLSGTNAVQAASLAGSNVGAAASGEPMMPMMPMGGMGGANVGGNGVSGRIPSWLVEHQDVWGTSIPAAPGLIED